MEVTQNTDYFENQLLEANTGTNNPILNQLISDMVSYARNLEETISIIPPGESLPPKPKPGELESIQFRATIEQLPNTISSELLSLLETFLTYIEVLESQIS